MIRINTPLSGGSFILTVLAFDLLINITSILVVEFSKEGYTIGKVFA
jgi:hypothetical protein